MFHSTEFAKRTEFANREASSSDHLPRRTPKVQVTRFGRRNRYFINDLRLQSHMPSRKKEGM